MNGAARFLGVAVLRISLLVSPRPAAFVVRRAFAKSGAELDSVLAGFAPDGVERIVDERYGDDGDEVLDVYRPSGSAAPMPTVVWVHGGAFVGGSKEELQHWFEVLAAEGHTVVAPRYSLAPERRYPTPVEQVLAALGYVVEHAERLRVDPQRLVLAGDSAGAQIAAQVATLVTSPAYAEQVGIVPTIAPEQLRAAVLCCGAYDPALIEHPGWFLRAVLWAYSGTRHVETDERFALMAVPQHVTSGFPPTFLTAGNGDPLLPQTTALAERLEALSVRTETLLYPPDTEPPLGHEYQFRLDTTAGQAALRRMLAFLAAHR